MIYFLKKRLKIFVNEHWQMLLIIEVMLPLSRLTWNQSLSFCLEEVPFISLLIWGFICTVRDLTLLIPVLPRLPLTQTPVMKQWLNVWETSGRLLIIISIAGLFELGRHLVLAPKSLWTPTGELAAICRRALKYIENEPSVSGCTWHLGKSKAICLIEQLGKCKWNFRSSEKPFSRQVCHFCEGVH